MIFYFWRIKTYKTFPPKALWFLVIIRNNYIMGEPGNKKFDWYICILGKKIFSKYKD